MEGVKRIRLCPKYLEEFSYEFGEVGCIKRVEEFRAPLKFEDLVGVLRKKGCGERFEVVGRVESRTVGINSEEQYISSLKNCKNRVLEIFVEDKSHPTAAKSPKKRRKIEKPFFLYLCKPVSDRRMKFVNVLSKDEKILHSDLFSRTARSISMGDVVYITGGRKIPEQVLLINTKSWEISKGPSLHIGRYWHAATIINNKISVIGGTQGEKKQKRAINSVEVLENNSWKPYPSLLLERASSSCCYTENFTFVLLGDYYLNYKLKSRSDLERWNGQFWESLPLTLPNVFSFATFALTDSTLLILGGCSTTKPLKQVLKYNLITNSYSESSELIIPSSFTFGQTCKISNTLFLLSKKLIEYPLKPL